MPESTTISSGKPSFKRYWYHRADGELAFWHVRKQYEDGRKDFFCIQPDPDGNREWIKGTPADADSILFRMPQLLDALSDPRTAEVAWCEGEKDANSVQSEWGIISTSVHTGRSVTDDSGYAWALRPDYRGKILVIADDDPNGSGLYTAWRRVEVLFEAGFDSHSIIVLLPAEGNDVTDHIEAGLGRAEMREMDLSELKARAPKREQLDALGVYEAETLKPGDVHQAPGARRIPDVPESAENSRTAGTAEPLTAEDVFADDDEEEEVVPAQDYPRNDTGNGDLLTAIGGQDMAWIPELAEWFCWNGHFWASDARQLSEFTREVAAERRRGAFRLKGKALEAAISFAVSCGNDAKIQAMLKRAAPGLSRPATALNASGSLLAVRNGTIELGAAGTVFREHRRADMITAVSATAWDADAQSDLWDDFLGRFVPGKADRDYLQRLMGYALLGANPERVLVFLIGPTSTGKTTFISLMQKTLGSALAGTFQLSMFRASRDDKPRPDILKAMARRMIFAEEASSEWNLHADTIKQATSHGKIEARGMRSNQFIERMPFFVPFIATNNLPEIRYADSALKKRLLAFPFRQQVISDQDDTGFIERIGPADRSAILLWLVRGYEAYCRKKLSAVPPAVSAETEKLRQSLSPVDLFLGDECVQGGNYSASSAELYTAFDEWWKNEKLRPQDQLTRTAFGLALADRGFEHVRTEKMRGWKGVGLADESG